MDDYEGKKKKKNWGSELAALTLSHFIVVACHATASLPVLCMNRTVVPFMAEKLPLGAKHLNQVSKKKRKENYILLDTGPE